MLNKNLRLERNLVQKVLKEGKKSFGPAVSLKYLASGHSAFAFIAPASAAKKAVIRNKIKRRGRAIVYKLLPNLKKNYWVVIFFGKSSADFSFQELEREIIGAFKKIKLL
jgi:ribonuclease P protein component